MTKKIAVVLGHPDGKAFCGALAEAYGAGARQVGHDVTLLPLAEMAFDPVLRQGFRGNQPLESDLVYAQQVLHDAEHSVWVYPNWWGGPPALLKGFIDRAFLPGFAFQYTQGPLPQKLLKGRSAHVLMTLDTPVWWYRYAMGAPGLRVMQRGILQFSGISPVQSTLVGPVRGSSLKQREHWLQQAKKLGEKGF